MKIEPNRILTIQGRSTAIFVGILPYALWAITYFISPGYVVPFINHPLDRIILLVLIVWELIGFCILMKLGTLKAEQTAKEAVTIPIKMIPVIIVFIMPLMLLPMLSSSLSDSILPPLLYPSEGPMRSIIK